jgi:hypothetical protein
MQWCSDHREDYQGERDETSHGVTPFYFAGFRFAGLFGSLNWRSVIARPII